MLVWEYATKFELHGRDKDYLAGDAIDEAGDVVVWHQF